MSKRIIMKERPAKERKKDFEQVNLGYGERDAVLEAKRCLRCKNPACISGCPVGIDIPSFIEAVADKNFEFAAKIIKERNNLPAVCGRVCPQETQCEAKCVLKKKGEQIAIGNLERFVADWERKHLPRKKKLKDQIKKNGIKVAVIGSGPAGLTCAGDLSRLGFDVTVFESLHAPGGVLRYGIPEFRLSKDVLDYEINYLEELGVKIELNSLIGRTKSIDDLFKEGFKAIFIGTGAGLPAFLGVHGENLNNIFTANEFLVRVNLLSACNFPGCDTPVYVGKKTSVIGGGNTAIDAARTALRLGAEEVTLVYRRSEAEMPARIEEIKHAREEGIGFKFLTIPIKFTGNDKGYVESMECVSLKLGEPDESGRRRPEVIEGSNFIVPVDMVIVAIGLNPNPLLHSLTKRLETDGEGHLIVDDKLMTRIPGVFAGGDIVGGDTVILAMGMGKKAALSISEYLQKNQE